MPRGKELGTRWLPGGDLTAASSIRADRASLEGYLRDKTRH
jgi:hypothetical protein